jgi:SAM-dependent methyltransferase
MGAFSAEWLALREPADTRARAEPLAQLIADGLQDAAELRVLDLGAGTGANVRYLAKLLPEHTHWLLTDNDQALLDQAAARLRATAGGAPPPRIETRAVDLTHAVNWTNDDIWAGRDLITASALLDLVSEQWLVALAHRCRDAGAAVLFALTYNGELRCSPAEPEDEMVREFVNGHQRTNKGFGLALGPDAAESAARVFDELGYEVWRQESDWELGQESVELQTQIIEGWAEAAAIIAPEEAASLDSWKTRRLAHVTAGRSRLIVGHEDLAGWLPLDA